jgi:hypothetical protein
MPVTTVVTNDRTATSSSTRLNWAQTGPRHASRRKATKATVAANDMNSSRRLVPEIVTAPMAASARRGQGRGS